MAEDKFSYEILIGEMYDMDKKRSVPKQVIAITADQFEIIKMFANTEHDEENNVSFIINKCRFKVTPAFYLNGF